MAREAAQSGHARYLGPVRKFLLCLCPALFAGAVLTGVLWRAGLVSLLPGTWLLLYGCAVLSASTVTIASTMRLIGIMGALFVALGCLAFVSPARMHTALLGVGFGVLHIVFGLLVGRDERCRIDRPPSSATNRTARPPVEARRGRPRCRARPA